MLVLLGAGDGTFTSAGNYEAGNRPVFIAAGDLDRDGKLDAVVADDFGNAVSVLLNNTHSPWSKLGSALLGSDGFPSLIGAGTLAPESPGTLTLSAAVPSSPAVLLLALASTPVPFKGGTLVPAPVLSAIPMTTSTTGTIPLAWSTWPAGLSGLAIFFQYAIQDGGRGARRVAE